MNNSYSDIRDRIDEPPRWWDEAAVPRYCDPRPWSVADIYADEVAFVTISCQACATEFLVAFSWSQMDRVHDTSPLSERADSLHYGDPPHVQCCASGPTMNSEPHRIEAFWRQERTPGSGYSWVRVPYLEREIEPPWTTRERNG